MDATTNKVALTDFPFAYTSAILARGFLRSSSFHVEKGRDE